MPWKYIIEDLHGEKIDGAFYGKELQKNEIEFRNKKSKKNKDGISYVERKGYDDSFNSWID